MTDDGTTTTLDDLVSEILSHRDYWEGRKKPSRAPTAEEIESVVAGVYEASQQLDEAMPTVAAKLGTTIACHKGCPGKCCESLVLVSQPEAAHIATYLQREENAALREQFVSRARLWIDEVGENASAAADAASKGLSHRYNRLMLEHGRAHAMCPLNTDDCCDIHPARPLKCREAWVAETWVHCRASKEADPPKPRAISFPQHEAFFDKAIRVVAGLQNAAGGGVERIPLPIAVLRALGEAV